MPLTRFFVYPSGSPSPVDVTIAVPGSPFPEGETVGVTIAASCSPSCGTATILVDGVYAYGTGISSDGTIWTASLSTVTQGDHLIQAVYNDQTGTAVSVSPPIKFTVVPNTLPKPTETFTFYPDSPATGTSSLVRVALSCATSCGGGAGHLAIDGRDAGFNFVDGNGMVWINVSFTSPFDAVGQHGVTFSFWGTPAYSNVSPPPVDFNVSASVAPKYDAGQVTLTLNGVPETVFYNQAQNASPAALAAAMATAINGDPNAAVNATASGSALNVASKIPGAASNYAYGVAQSYDTADFSHPSFTATPANGNLAGGADASTGSGASQVVYGYSILQADGITSGYAANGNLLAYTDAVNGVLRNWTFGYDSLNRLTSGSTSTALPDGFTFYCWAYDSFGNRLAQAEATQQFSDPACKQPATATYTTTQVVYDASNHMTTLNGVGVPAPDAAGNTTDDGTHQFLYDPEGRICAEGSTAASITSMVQYLYDAEGRRVLREALRRSPATAPRTASISLTSTCLAIGRADDRTRRQRSLGPHQRLRGREHDRHLRQ